jgi:hypothetical protein
MRERIGFGHVRQKDFIEHCAIIPCSAQLGPTLAGTGQTNNLDHPIALSTQLAKFGTPEIRPT